jgi:oxygen-dependent protoporphyrinogen oxidase
MDCDVVIIGAGISGLTSAHILAQKGFSIQILEKDNRTGGVIYTEEVDGFLVEHGPNSTLDTSPVLHQLFKETEVEQELEYANEKSKNRYVVRNGALQAMPLGPAAFIKTRLFSIPAKVRLLKEPFIRPSKPDDDESLAGFVTRRLGQEFLDYAIDPFVSGVYAGVPEQLSVKSGFPKLYALEQRYGSLIKGALLGARERRKRQETSKQKARLMSFKKGMGTIISALENELKEKIQKDAKLTAIKKYSGGYEIAYEKNGQYKSVTTHSVILTIPAFAYKEIEMGFDFPLGDHLASIPYPSVAMVFFGYKKAPLSVALDGFGFLVPRKENKNILGTIWSSTIFSDRAPEGGIALTTFVGGTRQPHIAIKPDTELTELVTKDLRDLMGINVPPDVIVIKKWTQAIPQYNVGYQKIMDAVNDFETCQKGMFLSGNFRGGISVSDCIKQGYALSERIADYLKKE